MEQVDPAHPLDRRVLVEAKAAARARRRVEQTELLVEMDRPDRLPSHAGEIPDPEQLTGGLPRHGKEALQTLTFRLD